MLFPSWAGTETSPQLEAGLGPKRQRNLGPKEPTAVHEIGRK